MDLLIINNNMQEKYLTKDQMQTILDTRPKGMSLDDGLNLYIKNGWTIQGVNDKKETPKTDIANKYGSNQSTTQTTPALGGIDTNATNDNKIAKTAGETITNLAGRAGDVLSAIKDSGQLDTAKTLPEAGKVVGGAFLQSLGALGGGIGDIISGGTKVAGQVVNQATNGKAGEAALKALEALGHTDTGKAVLDTLKGGVASWQEYAKANPAEAKVYEDLLNAANIVPGIQALKGVGKGATVVADVASSLAERTVMGAGDVAAAGVSGIAKGAKNAFEAIPSLDVNLAKRATDFISADPEKKVETILKRSTPEELNNYLDIAKKSSISGEAAHPFEVVGNKLADTAKILENKLGEIGAAKSAIIEPLREGLGSFSKETKPLLDKLNALKNSFSQIDKANKGIVQSIIDDAKTISTKLDADKFIDKVQDAIYSGNKNLTLVKGSAVDKQLRGIIGEYNSALKNALPKEYSTLNKQYSELIDTLGVINSSLGEVVEGVPIRGASLIKQYFSPSGTKAKEIFEFIKKETNGEVDLAKDTTLAKFAGQIYDDPNVRSLLQGIGDIPTTVGGVISKVAEKVGGEKLQEAMRKSTIRKALKTTKPK